MKCPKPLPKLLALSLCGLTLGSSAWAAEPAALQTRQIHFPPAVNAQSTVTETTYTQENIQVTWAHLIDGSHKLSPWLLKNQYDGYLVTIENQRAVPIQLVSVTVPEKVAPELAYGQLKQSAGKAYALNAGMGLALAPLTFGGSLVLAVILTGPVAAAMANSHNKNTLRYVNAFPGQLPLDTLQAGESRQLALLVPKGLTPHLHLSLQPVGTQDIIIVTVP